jgi:hypothetical protein
MELLIMKRKAKNEKGYIDEFVEYQNNIYSYDYPKDGEMPIGVKYPNHPLGETIFNWICALIFFLLSIYITYLFFIDYEFLKQFPKQILSGWLVLIFLLLTNERNCYCNFKLLS